MRHGHLRSDGAPVSTPTWYLWEDDSRILINLGGPGAPRAPAPRSAGDPHRPRGRRLVHPVTLIGRIDETRDDEDLTGIDHLSRHYTGSPYPDGVRQVGAWIEVEPLAQLAR